MKSLILLIGAILITNLAVAQEPTTEPQKSKADSIQTQKVEKDISKEIDSVAKVNKELKEETTTAPDSVENISNQNAENEVKYYQSIPESDSDSDSSSEGLSGSYSSSSSTSNSTTYYKVKKKRNRNDIKTLTGSMRHSGGFGALTFKSTDYLDETMILAGLRGGWIVNRTLAIGIEVYGIVPTTKYESLNPIDGESANVLGGYGGMFLEPIFFSNEVVHVTFPVSAGAGWMGYSELNNSGLNGSDGLISEDVFWYVEPGVALELNIARNFRLNFGVSKRITQDLDMFNTESNDFNSTNYFLSLKVGGF